MATPPPLAGTYPVSPAAAPIKRREPEIVVIPEKFYGVALKMKPGEWPEEKPPAPTPPVPPPPAPAQPVMVAPVPSAWRTALPMVAIVLVLILLVAGGFVYLNRETLFRAPSTETPPTPPPIVVNPPSAPGGVTAQVSGQGVSLTWLDSSGDEQGFRIERKQADGTFLALTNVPANSTAFLDVSVQPGTAYAYRVIAQNAGGESGPSNEASATLPAATPPPPAAPSLPPHGLDSDSDGLTDVEERLYGTDEQRVDSDADSYLDGNEVFHLYNPKAKAPGTLVESGLIKVFTGAIGWKLYVPNGWNVVLDRPDGSAATIASGTGETFVISVEDNPQRLPLLDWYASKESSANGLRSFTTKGGLEGMLSADRLTAIFAWEGKVFRLRYDLDGQTFINFRTTYEVMLNSLSLTGAPLVQATLDLSQGPGDLTGLEATSTVQMVVPTETGATSTGLVVTSTTP